ncbi:MAG: hypothetical protein AMJ73_00035 [candidate division Zixibacteria bacterium SM1_73]|nr:MAG: hypothetical protein AMJ73_00035 [candidate division Zixibacteria bacterium SM1_73]
MQRDSNRGKKINIWVIPRPLLTPSQRKVVKKPLGKHQIVFGPVGSGKTQVLLHRAAYLAETYGVPTDRYRVFVFTNMAREYIRRGAQLLGLPEETVTTFDQWCRLFYEKHISKDLPRTYINLRIDFQRIRSDVLNTLGRKKGLHNCLEFALVDDGQDLNPEAFEILRNCAHHVTVFADFQQKIVENKTSEPFILETLKEKNREETLTGTYRNAPYVANLASYFISNEILRRLYLAQISSKQKRKEHPLCYLAPSYDKELDELAASVQMRQSRDKKVGIIVPSNSLLHELAKEMLRRGVKVDKVIERDAQNVLHEPYDFGDDVPKITTYHTAKGLTFGSVFLPRLTEHAFHGIKGAARQRVLFVGITRARKWVYLSTVRGNELKEINLLRTAAASGHLLML